MRYTGKQSIQHVTKSASTNSGVILYNNQGDIASRVSSLSGIAFKICPMCVLS